MSTFLQAGDFEVVRVQGRIQKRGGNLSSCFCTPEGLVVHAVGGPVTPERFLSEAEWAVRTYHGMLNGAGNYAQRKRFVQQAHLSELHASDGGAESLQALLSKPRALRTSRQGRARLRSAIAHQLFAGEPLPSLVTVHGL